MKKQNERNAGRKRHGDKLKVSKSISIDTELLEHLIREFGSLSRAVQIMGMNDLSQKYGDKICE